MGEYKVKSYIADRSSQTLWVENPHMQSAIRVCHHFYHDFCNGMLTLEYSEMPWRICILHISY